MAGPAFLARSYAGGTSSLQVLGNVGATDLSFTCDPTIGNFANWPTGGSGPFCVGLDQGLPSFEKILCSAFNPATGVFTVYVNGGFNGRGYDNTTGVTHVAQPNIPQVILTWTAVEAAELNQMVVDVMGGAATGSAGQVLTIVSGAPAWQTPGGSSAGLMPIGGILLWAKSASFPSGFLACNGQLISTTTYSTLFGILSTTYGSGAGTFGLPNFNDKFPIGYNSSGIATTVGATGGSTTIATGNLPAHSHGVTDPGHQHPITGTSFITGSVATSTIYTNNGSNIDHSPSWNLASASNTSVATTGITTNNTGSGTAYTQPYIGMVYLMRCL